MNILSLEFLVFVAAVMLVYYILPLRIRWLVLLLASGVFYSFAGWESAVYLAATAALTWTGAMTVGKTRELSHPKLSLACMVLTLVPLLGGMSFIKYGDAVRSLIAGEASSFDFIVPLGLSWFTFQAAGYVIDVYRGTAEAERNPLRLLLFLGYFPFLTQGPVSTWKELAPQLREGHRLDPAGVTAGFQLMLWGYFKKMVIADRMANITAWVCANEAPGWLALAAPFLYMVQLYADFSGGMDVIRGVSGMLGITLPENFRRPFFSVSVAEYWRRWHITLGTWFRSYLLYPVTTGRPGRALGRGASRLFGKKAGRQVPAALATVLIFFLIGIWHGASLNAVIYGLYFGILMGVSCMLEPLFRLIRKKLGKADKSWWMTAFRWLRTMLLLALPQYFAFASGTEQAFTVMARVPLDWSVSFSDTVLSVMETPEWIVLGAALLILLVWDILQEKDLKLDEHLAKGSFLLRWPVLLFLILAIVVFGCYGKGYNAGAFLYTQF